MPQTGFLPRQWEKHEVGRFLTFIVPADGGCNLKCPFCFISQREEITQDMLPAAAYGRFIEGVAESEPVAAVAIQGIEPFLPSSLPYTGAILRASTGLGIPTSIVTNGTHMEAALPLLRAFPPTRIGVSLDAAEPVRHDRVRRSAGAWEATVASIRASRGVFAAQGTSLTVISVLRPRGRADLDDMPALLRSLGVAEWIVNPLMVVGRSIWSGEAQSRLIDDLLALAARARQHEVAVVINDEQGLLQAAAPALADIPADVLSLRTLPPGIVLSRLLPSGQCSVGDDISKRMSPEAPRWVAELSHPAQFLAACQPAHAI
jgi:MoaA/NifB/PqqE/SkfB family radical SAM enzyme